MRDRHRAGFPRDDDDPRRVCELFVRREGSRGNLSRRAVVSKTRRGIRYSADDTKSTLSASPSRTIFRCLRANCIDDVCRNFFVPLSCRANGAVEDRRELQRYPPPCSGVMVDYVPREIPGVPWNLSPVCLNIGGIERSFETCLQ